MSGEHTILITLAGSKVYMAFLERDRSKWASGSSAAEAIGELVRAFPALFNVAGIRWSGSQEGAQ